MTEIKSLKLAAPADSPFLNKRLVREKDELKSDPVAREPFQRDRDRIIHSRAFRRLMHKTQIFNANYGDHYRNRLTHTLEVCQISRSIGKALGLNDELIEAIALGHDLGHTPFGHIGERTLHNILSGRIEIDSFYEIGEGFKHNYQGLQVIDNIESEQYGENGMNLTLAVREGVFKHTSRTMKVNGVKEMVRYCSLNLENIRIDDPSFTLEGQVVAIADEIAQCTHDLEDGFRAGIIKIDDLKEDSLFKLILNEQNISCTSLKTALDVRTLVVKNLVGYLIRDVYFGSCERLNDYLANHDSTLPQYSCLEDCYHEQLICFTEHTAKLVENLSDIIRDCVIASQWISQSDAKAEYMIMQLFKAYYKHPKQLPDYILQRYCRKTGQTYNRSKLDDTKLCADHVFVRMICDHIACMTDQFAEREYKRLYIPDYI